MPITVTKELYTFDELSPEAKERARDWYRTSVDDSDFSCEIDEFQRFAEIIGVDFDTHEVPLYGGGTRRAPNIWWSGFCSQGDGACFEGTYSYKPDAVAKLKAELQDDHELVGIAEQLVELQREHLFALQARVRHTGRYYHEHSVEITAENTRTGEGEDEGPVSEVLRDMMRYLYRTLDDQNDYINSDEHIDEAIEINEYTFDEEGRRAD